MIPKTIHYCWFGHNPKPKLARKCLDSWRKHCKGWKFVEWNEDNYDIAAAPLYVRQAYEAGKWAFVSDYVRLQVVYEKGGVYLDSDVEILKPLDPLLRYDAYFGFENSQWINTGLGFGAVAGAPILREMMGRYENIAFVKPDGSFDLTPCPVINTEAFLHRGMRRDNTFQVLEGNVALLPTELLNPFSYVTRTLKKTDDAYSIHWVSATWLNENDQKLYRRSVRRERMKMALHWLLGDRQYANLKTALKRWREVRSGARKQ